MKVVYTISEDEKKIVLTPDDSGYDLKFNTTLKFKPMYDNIIVARDEEEETTSGGLYLAEIARDKPCTGTILAVGNGRLNELTGELTPLSVKVGERVLFAKNNGNEFEYGDEKIFVLREKDILCVME